MASFYAARIGGEPQAATGLNEFTREENGGRYMGFSLLILRPPVARLAEDALFFSVFIFQLSPPVLSAMLSKLARGL